MFVMAVTKRSKQYAIGSHPGRASGVWLGLVSEDPTEHYGTRQFEGDLCEFGPLGLLSCS